MTTYGSHKCPVCNKQRMSMLVRLEPEDPGCLVAAPFHVLNRVLLIITLVLWGIVAALIAWVFFPDKYYFMCMVCGSQLTKPQR